MNLFILTTLIFASTQATRRSDDDDWVHLPNKCEGRFVQFRILGSLKSLFFIMVLNCMNSLFNVLVVPAAVE